MATQLGRSLLECHINANAFKTAVSRPKDNGSQLHELQETTNMITISDDQIQQIVEKLIKAQVSTCAKANRESVELVVRKWLDEHIDSLIEDADWWVRNHGGNLHKYGLPYEDEIGA